MTLNVFSCFSGIEGLGLGLERAGMKIIAQVEWDPFCQQVLAHHYPKAARHDDMRTAATWWATQPRPRIDLVAGGVPCQPFSIAGRRRGIGDERWGWPWMLDVIRLVRPRYVLVENVPGLLADPDAFGTILADLHELGFDAEWSVVSACAVGAPHVRQRLFLVAYPHSIHGETWLGPSGWGPVQGGDVNEGAWLDRRDGLVAAARGSRRVVDGVPDRLESARVKSLGNAVVPAVAERVGRMIMRSVR